MRTDGTSVVPACAGATGLRVLCWRVVARAGAFLAGAFLAGAFLVGAFLAGAFLAGVVLRGAACFLAGAFLAEAFLAEALLAGVFFAGDVVGAESGAVLPAAAENCGTVGDFRLVIAHKPIGARAPVGRGVRARTPTRTKANSRGERRTREAVPSAAET